MKRKLYKSSTDKKICGVCGGLADYLDIDPSLVRIAVVLLALWRGTGLIFYLIVALILPYDKDINNGPIDVNHKVVDEQNEESSK